MTPFKNKRWEAVLCDLIAYPEIPMKHTYIKVYKCRPETADANSSILLKNPRFAEEYRIRKAESAQRADMTRADVLSFWKDMMLATPEDYFDQDADGQLIPKDLNDIPVGARRALKSISQVTTEKENGEVTTKVTYRIKDESMKASENIARALGMFKGDEEGFNNFIKNLQINFYGNRNPRD